MILPESHYNLLLGLYIPVMILGTSLNLFLLLTILTTKKLRQDPRNSFILALAISDFFLCNFTCPLTLWNTLEGHWPFGGSTTILCKFLKAGQDFPIIMSSFCIGAIACDRFRYIVQNNLPQMTATQVIFQIFFQIFVDFFFFSGFYVFCLIVSFWRLIYRAHFLHSFISWTQVFVEDALLWSPLASRLPIPLHCHYYCSSLLFDFDHRVGLILQDISTVEVKVHN